LLLAPGCSLLAYKADDQLPEASGQEQI